MTTTNDASLASSLPATTKLGPARFALGQVVATPGALALLDQYGINLFDLLTKHASGDFGDVCAEDAQTNEAAITQGARVLSCYTLVPGVADSRIWIITEWDRSVTTALKPSEY